ncbi:MAG: hypothetical protein M1812_008253 [Candelaria pacifica]|nr:MAG: hypothetical protein M1812_008253 [Candelaria pacifica]
MGKPRMIILIRHAQSEGNSKTPQIQALMVSKNRDIHQTVPDHRVRLTTEGQKQAEEAGVNLRSLLKPDDKIHFFTSPYRRTRETTEGILKSLTSNDPSPSPFQRHAIKVYEEPRLREQDFGNFQPCSAEMERMWQERADYGHFFYRIPNGESAADAYDRISGFNESLWRQFGEDDFANVCVLVTHGLMTRVFLMKWFHFSVEYFEDLRNVNHCEFVTMNADPISGKYTLQNQLRTWSALKRERAAAQDKAQVIVQPESPIPVRKRWGGCPEGCDHAKDKLGDIKPRQKSADISSRYDDTIASPDTELGTPAVPLSEAEDDPRGQMGPPNPPFIPTTTPIEEEENFLTRHLSPNRIYMLRVGRDGGGSRSGATSRAGSSSEEEEDDGGVAKSGLQRIKTNPDGPNTGVRARADALGDQMDGGEDGGGVEDLERMEAEDRSLRGGVY